MNQEFIEYLKALMAAAPQVIASENVKKYIETIVNAPVEEKPALTENGKMVLQYMQKHQDEGFMKARDIAEGLFVSSRAVTGSLRKLVTDGFVDKMGNDPILYKITEKGKNFNID
jgi:DNA-binding MarR family transcriptional regulator